MAFVIDSSIFQGPNAYQPTGDLHPYTGKERLLASNILLEMKRRVDSSSAPPLRDSYSSYMPDIIFPAGSGLAGNALGLLWGFCHDYYLPWLNMLVELKNQPYPGRAIEAHYVATYENMAGFVQWANHHAQMAEDLLACHDIVIV
jgi:hypothetical protein